jgi:hypothetical protein
MMDESAADREAKTQIKLLDQLLKVKEPWDREVDVVRNRSVSGEAEQRGMRKMDDRRWES